MGWLDGLWSLISSAVEDYDEAMCNLFEEELRSLGLSKSDIEVANLDQLTNMLSKIKHEISKTENNKKRYLTISHKKEKGTIDEEAVEQSLPVSFKFVLVVRQRQILSKIEKDEKTAQIKDIVAIVDDSKDEEMKKKFDQKLKESENNLNDIRKQIEELSNNNRNAHLTRTMIDHNNSLQKQKMIIDNRLTMIREFLKREPAATLVGMTIVMFCIFLHSIALVVGYSVPEILNNALLIVLGYFFGQSAAKPHSGRAG